MRRLISVSCKARDLTHQVAEATEGDDLAPLLQASIAVAKEARRLRVHERLHEVIEWGQRIPYGVVELWPVEANSG